MVCIEDVRMEVVEMGFGDLVIYGCDGKGRVVGSVLHRYEGWRVLRVVGKVKLVYTHTCLNIVGEKINCIANFYEVHLPLAVRQLQTILHNR